MIDPLDPSTSLTGALDLQKATDQATLSQRALNAELDISKQLGNQFGRALTSAFVGIAVQGKSLGDVLQSLATSLSKLALSAAFKPLETALGGLLGGLTSGGAGGLAGVTSLAAGTPALFAGGGSIAAPPAFPFAASSALSSTSGSLASQTTGFQASSSRANQPVTPHMNVTFNVTSPDAESFRRSETQIAAMLARTVGSGQRNL